MNCHQARQLISPYLDHQLTGREMLALQDHLAACVSCDRERQSIRQVKMLLRGLQEPRLPRDFSQTFSQTVALRLEQPHSAAPSWRVLTLSPPRPQRGRRLVTALALSCLTIMSFALPFAPEAHESERASAAFATDSPIFTVPSSADALLSGQPPERVLLGSPSASLSSTQLEPVHSDSLVLVDMETPVFGLHPQETSFGSGQFAVFRSR